MSISFFIQYAVPTIIMALVGLYLPTADLDDKVKFTAYTLCVLITFVFKYYADILFKRAEQKALVKKEVAKDEYISSLEAKLEDLRADMLQAEVDHATQFQRIERNLSNHLKKNYKSEGNEGLWSGVQRVTNEIVVLTEEAMENTKRINKKTNKKS